jgi:predicted nicotinamide N-methyase
MPIDDVPTETLAPFEIVGGSPSFHGVPVEYIETSVAGEKYSLAVLRDAAALLDVPEFASRFLELDRAPYGLQLWDAAIALSEFLDAHEPGAGGRALELGCGVGLVAMVLSRNGWRVCASDHEPDTLAFTKYNVRQNKIEDCEFKLVDWNRPDPGMTFDLIVGADVAYQKSDHAPLLSCLRDALAPEGRAYLCDPMRSAADSLPATARESGLIAERQQWEWRAPVRIWKLTLHGQ